MKRIVTLLVTSLSVFLCSSPALAKKVYSPIVKQGEVEFETQNEVLRSKDPVQNGKSKHQFEVSYGLTERWHLGVYAVYEQESGSQLQYTQTKWANIIQLTEQGEYWLDMGFYIEYIWAASGLVKPDVLEVKALFERPIDQWKHTLNIVFKQPMSGNTNVTSLGYAWRSRYKMDSGLEPVLEVYGSLGELGNIQMSGQTHLIGPVVEYKFLDDFEVNVGWLMNTNEGFAYGDFKFNLEYKF